MPYLIGHDLVVRILHHKPDLLALGAVVGIPKRNIPVEDLPLFFSSWCKHAF